MFFFANIEPHLAKALSKNYQVVGNSINQRNNNKGTLEWGTSPSGLKFYTFSHQLHPV